MRRLAAVGMLALVLLGGCGRTDRPEGIVERWLTSLNQGSAGRPGRYAPDPLSQSVLPNWRECEPGALDIIEVGRGERTHLLALNRMEYSVPFRVDYATDLGRLCGARRDPKLPDHPLATLIEGTDRGAWRVIAIGNGGKSAPGLRVPSEGGTQVARTSAVPWLIGLLVGLALCVIVALLMRAMPRPAPLSSEPFDPAEARGL